MDVSWQQHQRFAMRQMKSRVAAAHDFRDLAPFSASAHTFQTEERVGTWSISILTGQLMGSIDCLAASKRR
jgi:hypothetical protein